MIKNKLIISGIAFSFFTAIINPSITIAQCTHQVTHLTGTATINGINITVTSSGVISSLTYCAGATTPYFIGYNGGINGNGSYTFSFSPPVTGVTLNFGGTSNVVVGGIEEVSLYVNGVHYAIPSIGTLNSCEPMAVLTAAGDIAGCFECSVCGWSGTTVPGPVSSITVADSVLALSPNGTVFSLFICDSIQTGTDDLTAADPAMVFPNPVTGSMNIATTDNRLSEVILYDMSSRKLLQQQFINSVSLNTEQLAKGIYFYEVRPVSNSSGNRNVVIKKGKVIKE